MRLHPPIRFSFFSFFTFILLQLLAEREGLRAANSAHDLEQNDLALKEVAAELKVRLPAQPQPRAHQGSHICISGL